MICPKCQILVLSLSWTWSSHQSTCCVPGNTYVLPTSCPPACPPTGQSLGSGMGRLTHISELECFGIVEGRLRMFPEVDRWGAGGSAGIWRWQRFKQTCWGWCHVTQRKLRSFPLSHGNLAAALMLHWVQCWSTGLSVSSDCAVSQLIKAYWYPRRYCL